MTSDPTPDRATGAAARRAEIRSRLDAATPGPWALHPLGRIEAAGVALAQTVDADHNDYPNAAANEVFIVHCRDDVAWLLAHLAATTSAADAALTALREALIEREAQLVFLTTFGPLPWEGLLPERQAHWRAQARESLTTAGLLAARRAEAEEESEG